MAGEKEGILDIDIRVIHTRHGDEISLEPSVTLANASQATAGGGTSVNDAIMASAETPASWAALDLPLILPPDCRSGPRIGPGRDCPSTGESVDKLQPTRNALSYRRHRRSPNVRRCVVSATIPAGGYSKCYQSLNKCRELAAPQQQKPAASCAIISTGLNRPRSPSASRRGSPSGRSTPRSRRRTPPPIDCRTPCPRAIRQRWS